ncbi:zinc finger protein 675-like [Anthonomus grandis grandis]|uniref:zinc finger protein 675-like n=1 Tax=Anthonomus grandis grandis TaxID=2921223 RepID=UPI00216557F4|nr:zinc finger protein 675-like [Anthonomus grandis grandis]
MRRAHQSACDLVEGVNFQMNEEDYIENAPKVSQTAPASTYPCDMCGFQLTNANGFKEHCRHEHHVQEKPFECDICKKRFFRRYNLEQHIKKLHLDKQGSRALCQVCGKYFYSKANLSVHMKLHTNDKQFKCHLCEHAFASHAILKRHSIVHTGEMPHNCEVCGATFMGKIQYDVHKLSHTGGCVYQCDECHKVFVDLESMNSHKVTYHCDFFGQGGY